MGRARAGGACANGSTPNGDSARPSSGINERRPEFPSNASFQIGDRTILRNLTLSIEAGETLVLLGRSGSGKTTALRLINGMTLPSSGEVLVEGKTTAQWDRVRLRRRIGYVIQEGGLFPHFTVERNIGLVPRLEGWPESKVGPRVAELLERVSLPPRASGRGFRANSPVDNASASVWRAHSRPTPRFCFSTNPLGPSIPSRGSTCSANSCACR